ncbi:MAG: C45 family peptidase [Candidatus Margulisiibacteriota bacterium]
MFKLRIVIIIISVLLLAIGVSVCGTQGSTPTPSPSGSLEIKDGFYVLHLRGSAEDMGRQHGTLLKDQITEFVQEYLFEGVVEESGVPWALLAWTAKEFYEDQLPDDFKTELHAIAEASGVSYEAVLVCQLMGDMPDLTQTASMGGTSFIAKGGATSGGTIIHGANVEMDDYNNSLRDRLTIIYYEPTNGNKFVSLSAPGLASVIIGMNEKHVALSISAVEAGIDQNGLPTCANLRRALQYSDSLSEAADYLTQSDKRTRGYIVPVSCGSPEGLFVMELSPNHYKKREIGTLEALVSADHFISQEMQPYQDGASPVDSVRRYNTLMELITQNYGSITESSAESFMSDRSEPNGDYINNDSVIYSSILLPQELTFWVAKGPVSSVADYVSFSLEE